MNTEKLNFIFFVAILCLWCVLPASASGVPISGRVVASGEPLADVQLSLVPALTMQEEALLLSGKRPRSDPEAVARSGRDGRFRLDAPRSGMWSVRAFKKDRAPMILDLRPLLEEAHLPTLDLPAVVQGVIRVVDDRSGPVDGARVVVESEEVPWYRSPPEGSWRLDRQLTATDEAGRATVMTHTESTPWLGVVARGFVPALVGEWRGSRRTVRLERAEELSVEVLDHRRRPLSDVVVWHAPSGQAVGVTDDVGAVDLFDPARTPAEFRFLAPDGAALETVLPRPEKEGGGGEQPAGPLRVLLDPPRFLDGRVISVPHRDPVAGALVWREGAAVLFAETGSGGGFRLPRVPWYEGALRWGAPGYFPDRLSAEEVPASGGRPALVLHPAGALAGMVLSADGQPLAGVEVRTRFDSRKLGPFQFNPPHWQRRSGGIARSREDGRFRLGSLVPDLEYELTFRLEGYAPRTALVRVAPTGVADEDLSIVLQRGISAVGEVLDRSGEPVAGAVVTLTPARPPDVLDRARRMQNPPAGFSAITDRDGAFRVQGLPPDRLDLAVRAAGFAAAEILGIQLERPQNGDADLGSVVLSPEARIRGRVEDPEGEPIPGVAVRILPEVPVLALVQDRLEPEPEAVTAGDGWFELGGLRSGERAHLRFDRGGFASRSVRAVPTGGEPMSIMLEPTLVLAGRVTGPRGEPVGEALVMVEEAEVVALAAGQEARAGKPTSIVDRTGRDGSFELENVPRGTNRLHVKASGWQDWSERLGPTSRGKGDGIEIVLEPAAVVDGTVFGADGQPVVGAEVREWAAELPSGAISYRRPLATTDGDGVYRIDGLPPGSARFEARHPAAGRAVRELDAAPGENSLDFQLEGGQRVSGQVLDPGGSPAAGAKVVLRSRMPSWTPPVTHTDGGGLFSFEGLTAGRYALEAEATGVGRSVEPVIFEITDRPADDLMVELASTGTVTGRILGLGPDELAGLRLHAGPLLDLGRVDHRGRYTIEGLSPGEWTIIGEVPGTGERATGSARLDSENPEAVLDLDFGTGFDLTGLVEVNGEPRGGLMVTVHGATGPVGWDRTGRDGGFSVFGLSEGEYRLEVVSADRTIRYEGTIQLDSDRSVVVETIEAEKAELES